METHIKVLDSKIDEGTLLDIVKCEDEIFGEGSIGKWNIKPFAKYGKVFTQFSHSGEIISVIEVLRGFNVEKAYLYGVFTVPKYKNMGYGKKILKYVLEYLREIEIKEVELTVEVENKVAIGLYKSFNFEIVEILENEYGDNKKRYLMRCNF